MRCSSGRALGSRRAAIAGTLPLVALLLGCIQVVQTAPPMEPEPQTPDPLVSLEDPKLQPTATEGLFAVPGLKENVFYYEPNELWYRYEYRKWFQAFRWDGYWFVPDKVPDAVKAQVPEETPETLKDQLKALDQRLEKLDREERLQQLEHQLEEIDQKESGSGSGGKSPAPSPSSAPAPSSAP